MTGSQIIAMVLSEATPSVEELAQETGISAATLFAWQAGRRNPSPDNLEKLAQALRRRGGALTALADDLEAQLGK